MPQHKEAANVLYYQDFFPNESLSDAKGKEDGDSSYDPAEAFFELANAPLVGYRLAADKLIVVRQDNTNQSHTGGIVWETSYLLASFLIVSSKKLGKVLEVGAGCGLLGLVLAASGLCSKVVATETTPVIENLRRNVSDNVRTSGDMNHGIISASRQDSRRGGDNEFEQSYACCSSESISVHQLRWEECKKDAVSSSSSSKTGLGADDLSPHSFDTIVGTDVIFSKNLVKPLLKTLRRMSHSHSVIYLCVQVRCAESHSLFLELIPKYDFDWCDRTSQLGGGWVADMECILLMLTPRHSTKVIRSNSSKSQKRKDSRNKKRDSNEGKKRSRINPM